MGTALLIPPIRHVPERDSGRRWCEAREEAMVCSRDRVGVEDFGGEWKWVIVLGTGMEVMGCEEYIFAIIRQEY